MIKNIIFDLGGVIIPLNRVACLRAFEDVVGYKNFGDILSTYRQVGFFELFENGEISAKQFRQNVRLNISPDENGQKKYVSDSQIDYSLNKFLDEIPQNKIETLLFLRNDYKMILLSNTNPISMKKARELFIEKGYKVEELFEEIFLSYKMKASKPNEKIFAKMLKKTMIDPSETLYIDDAPANIEMGNRLGFKSILYNVKDDLYDTISKSFQRE